VHGIEGLHVIANQMDELSHYGFDACWISGRVGCSHEHAVEPFIVRTDPQPLTSGPFSPGRVGTL
jgi:hypothetical protein